MKTHEQKRKKLFEMVWYEVVHNPFWAYIFVQVLFMIFLLILGLIPKGGKG